MGGPIYRNWYWWQYDGSDWPKWDKTGWKTQNKQDYPFPRSPSRWRRWQITGSEPFQVYLLGILAAIATLGITLAVVSNKSLVAAILAPVIGVIGAFTGHAAGHSSAVAVMKERVTYLATYWIPKNFTSILSWRMSLSCPMCILEIRAGGSTVIFNRPAVIEYLRQAVPH